MNSTSLAMLAYTELEDRVCTPLAMPDICVVACIAVFVSVQDRSLVDADPVIWYSFGVTHLPRVEVRYAFITDEVGKTG